PRSVAPALDDEGHERDQQRPGREDVEVERRNAGELAGPGEEVEQGIVEEQQPEQGQRGEALTSDFRAHRSLPAAGPGISRRTARAAPGSPGFPAWSRPA